MSFSTQHPGEDHSCRIEGCSRIAETSGLCEIHRYNSKRYTPASTLTPGERLTDEQHAEIKRMHKAFKSNVDIARKLGVSKQAVARSLKR